MSFSGLLESVDFNDQGQYVADQLGMTDELSWCKSPVDKVKLMAEFLNSVKMAGRFGH